MAEGATSPIPQRRSTLGLSVAALLSVAAALTGLAVLFDEGLWGPTAMLVATTAVAAAALARVVVRGARRLWTAGASLAAAAVAVLLALTVLFAADTALLAAVPTPATLQRFSELISAGELSIAVQAVPAAADDGIRFLLASGAAALAVLVDAVASLSRRPGWVAIPLLGVLAVPVVLEPGALPVYSVLATGAAFLLLLALHRPAASGGASAAGRAIAVAAGVLVTAIVVPPLLPPVTAGTALPGTGGASLVTGINPIIELGDDLRRTAPVTALRYSTTADGGLYLTLSHFAEFTEQSVQPVMGGTSVELGTVGPPAWLGDAVATTPVSTRIELDNVRTRWLPLPSSPVLVSGLSGEWMVNEAGVTVSTVEGSVREGAYDVDSLVAQPTFEQLRAATVLAAGLEQYRALPADLDPSIAATAARVADAAPGDSAYDDALALQRYFTQGDFVYSESAPVELGFDGTGAGVVAVFLEVKSGYCVHFAAAMTLMARSLGIPARIAVGFLPGSLNPDAPGQYIVSTDDLHAWPELHFDGVGWVRFEPTPARGMVPEYAAADVPPPNEVPEVDPETGESVEPEPDAAPEVDPVDDPIDTIDDGDVVGPGEDVIDDPLDEAGESATLDGGTDARALAAALTALLVALVFAPGVMRAVRRAVRLRSSDALDHWREARDTARDLGLPADPEQTPRQLAAAWSGALRSDDRARLDSLRVALEARAFARGSQPGDTQPSARRRATATMAAHTRVVVDALRESAPWWRRTLARVAPVSLLDRTPRDERFAVEHAALSADDPAI